jgi:hypothetical protein
MLEENRSTHIWIEKNGSAEQCLFGFCSFPIVSFLHVCVCVCVCQNLSAAYSIRAICVAKFCRPKKKKKKKMLGRREKYVKKWGAPHTRLASKVIFISLAHGARYSFGQCTSKRKCVEREEGKPFLWVFLTTPHFLVSNSTNNKNERTF